MSHGTDTRSPQGVETASTLLWISAILTLVVSIAAYTGLLSFRIAASSMVSNLITTAFLALCAVKIRAGRNWARWLLLILFAIGSGVFAVTLCFQPQMVRSLPLLFLVVALVQVAIQAAAVVLSFVPASSTWFRARAREMT